MKKVLLLLIIALLLKNTTNAQVWTPQVSGTTNNLFSISFPTNNLVGHICGSEGTILKTVNGGTNWVLKNSGTNFDLYEIHFFDANKGFAVGTGNTLLLTSNGGESWSRIDLAIADDSYYYRNMWFLDDNIGFITGGRSGNNGVVLRTLNGGITWEELNVNSSSAVYGIYFTSPDTGYFSNFNGEISKTKDGGATWQKLSSGTSNSLISLYFTNETTGYACGFEGTILKTTDQGATWDLITNKANEFYTDIIFLDEFVGFVIGGDANSSSLLKTTDKGETWIEENTSTSRLFGGEILSYAAAYSCGFNGSILKITDIPASSEEIKAVINNVSVFPNPTKDKLTIDLGPNVNSGKLIKVLNNLGMVVESQTVNNPQSVIDLSTLGSSGIYYVIISDVNNLKNSEIRKVILL